MAYTTIDDPSKYFHIQLYNGNNLTTQTITNDANSGDFQADWLWIKNRDDVEQHHLMDSNRGANKFLHSNSTDDEREGSYNGGHNDINAFGSNGFTITSNGSGDELNFGTRTYVAWQWKANGGTTTTNDASSTGVGTIDSVYQANTTAGFSIVTYTGTNAAGTIAHGLGAVPDLIITKNRVSANSWAVYHSSNTSAPETDFVLLNTTDGTVDNANRWNATAPTSTVFSVKQSAETNNSDNSDTFVAYAFTSIQGYSKFGSYKGNGNADGPFIYTGFKPKYFVLKNVTASSGSGGQHWQISDTERHPNNPLDLTLFVEDNAAEGGTWSIKDFLSNGVKIRGSNYAMNYSGDTYIYMAFAEHPFVSSKGVPVTAR